MILSRGVDDELLFPGNFGCGECVVNAAHHCKISQSATCISFDTMLGIKGRGLDVFGDGMGRYLGDGQVGKVVGKRLLHIKVCEFTGPPHPPHPPHPLPMLGC